MTSSTIDTGAGVITVINRFTVEPERQQELVDLLVDATETVIKHLPGFISANLHKSLDGKHVVNYAQWTDQQSLQAMLSHPDCRQHLTDAAAMSHPEPQLYTVASTHHP
ncbi:antibiotic biosynthesis monooxygenase family protein [Amycolatopsis nigrescens]|uniref:antibiotic biosynthesis monooxygenase family protein n=1 Tax=Amycolatopsis nigrescens TaxID=381445 RepID=UPI00037C7F8C|nr:antibiotic biosynthesis monooxygenase family protein [Amycolatopsis nigrescens]